jgi:hypothetical protein
MKLNPVRMGRRALTPAISAVVLAIALCSLTRPAVAQTEPTNSTEPKPDTTTYQTFYLTSVAEQRNANDIVTDLRNMLPRARVFYVPSQYAISLRGSAQDIQTAQKILSDIDRPRRAYRLTYSLTELDGDKTIGTQKVSLIALDSGDRVIIKQGDKVPVITGTTEAGSSAQNTEVQYEDIGLNIEASVEGSPDALRLNTRIVQSSVADQRAASGVADPTFQQTVLDGITTLVPGKPLVLGSLDIPGTTHREEVSVVSELVR